MKKIYSLLLLQLVILACSASVSPEYPSVNERIATQENETFYINPQTGDDTNSGIRKNEPWKTFKPLNQRNLNKGNRVEILSEGAFNESLTLIGKGTKKAPIVVHFAKGQYDFFPEKAFRRKMHISNTNDAPDSLKAITFYLSGCENIRIESSGATFRMRGKSMFFCIEQCKSIHIEGLNLDYKRPTVSEMTVQKTGDRFADVSIHKDSKYQVKDTSLIWVGEGWKYTAQPLWQKFNPASGELYRMDLPIDRLRFSEISPNTVRIHFDKNPGLTEGCVYQNRDTFRDYAAIFTNRSKDISWKNIHIYFMHGMGFLNQFSENISYESVQVKPASDSGRTCAAWADILHFSGCKGNLLVNNCCLTAANDDAINVHGTHLRIKEVLSDKKMIVSFVHSQTYGFDAFQAKDKMELIRSKTLLPYAKNKILQVRKLNDKDFELVVEKSLPKDIQPNDVVENTTWTANLEVRNTFITHIPTRGILVSTRGKVLIEKNELQKTRMSGILISDDANSWFESGYVRDVTIRNNQFLECGEPVINIHPENAESVENKPVHKNIQICNNFIKLQNDLLLSAKSTENIKLYNNIVEGRKATRIEDLTKWLNCEGIQIKKNQLTRIP